MVDSPLAIHAFLRGEDFSVTSRNTLNSIFLESLKIVASYGALGAGVVSDVDSDDVVSAGAVVPEVEDDSWCEVG